MLIFIIMTIFVFSAYGETLRMSGTGEVNHKLAKVRDLGAVGEESPGRVLQEGPALSEKSGSLAKGVGEYIKGNRRAGREGGGANQVDHVFPLAVM